MNNPEKYPKFNLLVTEQLNWVIVGLNYHSAVIETVLMEVEVRFGKLNNVVNFNPAYVSPIWLQFGNLNQDCPSKFGVAQYYSFI